MDDMRAHELVGQRQKSLEVKMINNCAKALSDLQKQMKETMTFYLQRELIVEEMERKNDDMMRKNIALQRTLLLVLEREDLNVFDLKKDETEGNENAAEWRWSLNNSYLSKYIRQD